MSVSFRFTSGPKILVDFGNMILDEVELGAWKPGTTMKKGGSLFDFIQTASGVVVADLSIYDASSGSQCAIGVTPGQVTDDTNSSTVWVPTLNDPLNGVTPINVKSGMPARYPIQNVSTGDTWVYFTGTITTSSAAISALAINTGTSVPTSTSGIWYSPIGQIVSAVTAGIASVQIVADSRGSKEFAYCGSLPVPDGTGYRSGVVGI